MDTIASFGGCWKVWKLWDYLCMCMYASEVNGIFLDQLKCLLGIWSLPPSPFYLFCILFSVKTCLTWKMNADVVWWLEADFHRVATLLDPFKHYILYGCTHHYVRRGSPLAVLLLLSRSNMMYTLTPADLLVHRHSSPAAAVQWWCYSCDGRMCCICARKGRGVYL